MPTTLTKRAYEQLIAENIEWLLKQPATLERSHIIQIVQASAEHEYPTKNYWHIRFDEDAPGVACGFKGRFIPVTDWAHQVTCPDCAALCKEQDDATT